MKTLLIQNFGGKKSCIFGDVQVAKYDKIILYRTSKRRKDFQ